MAYSAVYSHFGRKGVCAAWFAVLCVILLGFIIGKHLVVLIIFSAISAFFVTLTWAIRLRDSSVH